MNDEQRETARRYANMELRDRYAGLAMQALIGIGTERSKIPPGSVDIDPDRPWYFGEEIGDPTDMLATDAFNIADAMIGERQRRLEASAEARQRKPVEKC